MKTIEKSNGVKLVINDLQVVTPLYSNEFNGKMRVTAHLTQERETTYPAQNMSTGFGGGLFENVGGEPFKTKRNTLMVVPENMTIEDVKNQAALYPEATIYRIVTNDLDEVISEREKSAIEQGFITKESLKAKYVVRDAEGNVYSTVTQDGEILEGDARKIGFVSKDGDSLSLEITNPNALLEYKRDIFSRTYVEDVDNRVGVKKNVEAHVEALQA